MNDLKFALRQLVNNPGFTAVAVISLALGIGASTAVFSLVDAILLRSLPVPHPGELRVLQWSGTDVRMSSFEGNSVQEGNRWTDADCVTHAAFLRLRGQSVDQAEVLGFCPLREAVVGIRGETFVADGMMVSDNFFSGLGVRPNYGRTLSSGEDYAGRMNVVISHGLWVKHFGGDRAVLGQALALNGTTYTIVGVLPGEFAGVQPGGPCEFYVPMAAGSPFLYTPITENWHWFVRLMARLRPGASEAQLRGALDVAFASEVTPIMRNPKIMVQPGNRGLANDRNTYGKSLRLMLGVIGLVMLVACANLAGLSLARGAARQHELAVRAAMGASRWTLIRQSLTESFTLTLIGGGLGVLLAVWGRTVLARLLADANHGLRYEFSLDLPVLLFSLAVTLLTALVSGLLPALRAGRADPLSGLKARGSLSAPRLRAGRILVAAQICLSLLLLAAAGLYARTLVNLTRIDAGFPVDRLLVVGLNIRTGGYAEGNPVQFYERLQQAFAELPGVQSAALSGFPLLAERAWSGGFGIRGRQMDSQASTCRITVSESFFPTLGIPILEGRGFESTDTADAPKVVIVNEKFSRNYLAGENPVGLTFTMLGLDWRIVGVCRDAKYDNIKKAVQPIAYFPFRQMFFKPSISKNLGTASIAVRTSLSPPALSAAVRRAVAQIDPGVAITTVTTQRTLRDLGISQERMLALLSSFLALLTMLLSCVGLYGLMAYTVARRANEIAIRIAIGAQPGAVARAVMSEAVVLASVGITVGLPAVFILTRLIRSQLYGVQPNDPLTLTIVILILLAIAIISAWVPALRAARVNPMTALRTE